jgi:hypothetical protein
MQFESLNKVKLHKTSYLIMKEAFKVFLVNGGLFGMFFGTIRGVAYIFFEGFQTGIIKGLMTFLLSGSLFGIGVLVLLFSQHISVLRKEVPKIFETDNITPHQKKVLVVRDIDLVNLKHKFRKALEKLDSFKALEESNYTLTALTKKTKYSRGETISILFNISVNNEIEVTMASSPLKKLTLVDCGKGFQNLETIMELVITDTN